MDHSLSLRVCDPGLSSPLKRSNNDSTGNPVAKKRRVTIRRPKCTLKDRYLEQEIPIEIWFEVFSYLLPYDLLRLARSNQAFRNLLMSLSSAFLWRRARANVDSNMPELPSDLSEPAYANLVFTTKCYVCFSLMRRLLDLIRPFRYSSVLWVAVAKSYGSAGFAAARRVLVLANNNAINISIASTILADICVTQSSRKPQLYLPAAERLNAELVGITGGAEAIEEWVREKIEHYGAIRKHADRCIVWESRKRSYLNQERVAIRTDQLDWISERTAAEGWEIEFRNLRDVHNCSIIKDALSALKKKDKTTLDDSDWARIQPLLTSRLRVERSVLYRKALTWRMFLLKETFDQFFSQPKYRNRVYPSLGDLVTLDGPVKRFIHTTPIERDLSLIFRPSSFETELFSLFSSAEFLDFSDKWKTDKEIELLQMIENASSSTTAVGAGRGRLLLAMMVFRCNSWGCRARFHYPDVLKHRCALAYSFVPDSELLPTLSPGNYSPLNANGIIATADGTVFDCCSALGVIAWNDGGARVSFDNSASHNFYRILDKAPFLDPRTMTTTNILAYNPILCCKTCNWGLFHWPDLLQHDIEKHDITVHQTTSIARNIHLRGCSEEFESWVFGLKCKLCFLILHPQAIVIHLRSEHLISEVNGNWHMLLDVRLPAYTI
ncbi:hypothetical protein BDP27DRAFT_1418445 [Rhodocollybia butyracea]|uniref:F-box domain-containing protein n=1 Tax=Rhodocollybia butyracea TaxID=206335 RepID=A0A9P5U9L2_9AGAR|nr:hypothetical protein BDP27DRAFT_1418445 [Rhodocollybia butyracea]